MTEVGAAAAAKLERLKASLDNVVYDVAHNWEEGITRDSSVDGNWESDQDFFLGRMVW